MSVVPNLLCSRSEKYFGGLRTCDFSLFFRKIMYSDLQTIAPEQYMKQITKRITELHAVSVSSIVFFVKSQIIRIVPFKFY